MKRVLRVALPVVVLLVGGGALGLMIKFRKQLKPAPVEVLPPLVEVVQARRQTHQFRVVTQGTVTPRTEIQLVPEVSGRVIATSPSLAAGGFFEPGEVLVEIDARDYELAVTRARSQLAQARVLVQREEAEADVARREWEKLGTGRPNPLLLREPQLAEARAAVASAEAALEQVERDLARCRIAAPFAGRVGEKNVDVGQYVTKGQPMGRLYAIDYAEIRLPLPTDEIAFVDLPLDYRGADRREAGPAVKVRARFAGDWHAWDGRIVRTDSQIDPRTRMATAVARVDDPYGRKGASARPPLAAGLFVEAEILGRQTNGVAVLPRTALRGNDRVFVIDPERKLQFRDVEVLRADRNTVVVSQGLEDGELVCVSPLDTAVDGMKVRLADAGGKEPGR
jgi:RND family efflux transporter MFP subunit